MRIFKINIKKVFLYILIIIVFLLVIAAVYNSRYKFTGINTIKYIRINIERATNIDELVEKYSSNRTREKFVSEIKKMNNMDSIDYISGNKTMIIPIIEN